MRHYLGIFHVDIRHNLVQKYLTTYLSFKNRNLWVLIQSTIASKQGIA